MSFSPDLERELRQSVRQARMVAFTCCFVAPAMYIISLGSQALRGHWLLFLAGFGHLPWADPRVPGTVAGAALALGLGLVLPQRMGRTGEARATLGALKARNLLSSALLVAVAVCGLFLGVKLGPPAASLSLVLFLVPMVRGWFIFPSESRWRQILAGGGTAS